MKSDVDEINNSRAVETMVHLDFVERAREKYGYDSNDEESEYESDEDTRTNNRLNFRLKIDAIQREIEKAATIQLQGLLAKKYCPSSRINIS